MITCISFPLCQLFGIHFEINLSIVSELSEREKLVESIYPTEKIPFGSKEKPAQSTITSKTEVWCSWGWNVLYCFGTKWKYCLSLLCSIYIQSLPNKIVNSRGSRSITNLQLFCCVNFCFNHSLNYITQLWKGQGCYLIVGYLGFILKALMRKLWFRKWILKFLYFKFSQRILDLE